MVVRDWEGDSQLSVLNSRAPEEGRRRSKIGRVEEIRWGLLELGVWLSVPEEGWICMSL